ncbi:Transposase [Cordylochernes scorpioides]|uniref:Transposase n=1 Tax=Cordylochernes scorpioides TaxID=51811 RepID=A0ABY6LUT4_9ARAC|nr:Transposase [Cordylochernes scorpioides]
MEPEATFSPGSTEPETEIPFLIVQDGLRHPFLVVKTPDLWWMTWPHQHQASLRWTQTPLPVSRATCPMVADLTTNQSKMDPDTPSCSQATDLCSVVQVQRILVSKIPSAKLPPFALVEKLLRHHGGHEDTQDAKLKAQKDRALAVIALSINTEHQIHIIDCTSPQDAWKNLEQVFESKSRSRILQLKKQFVNIKLQTGLPDSFDTLVMSFGNVEDSDFTSHKVRNTLLTEYERRSAREGACSGLGEALNFSKDDIRKTSRKQGVKCYRCSKIGHIAKDCRSSINRDYKADKSYSRKKDSFKSPSENMLMAFNAVSSEDEFILDSGATHHTASGNLQVEGVGNIRMKMYLDTGTQDVTLNDVLFVPQARRNLLSVSQTEDKGKHIKICNHKARVFSDNRVARLKTVSFGCQNRAKFYRHMILTFNKVTTVNSNAKEAVWLGQTLSDLGFISHFAKQLTIYCDNRSAIDFSKNNIGNNRSKHISVQFHYTRDKINSGHIVVQFVNTKENMADIQTKTLKKLMHRDACHHKRRQFKQTDAFTRGMVIGLKRAGWSIRQIAADTHLGASTVHRLWRRWLEQGNVAIYRNSGATRVTSARVDRRIFRQAVAAPQATCTAILQHVQDTLDHSISTRTISRRLVANGLHSCRPLRRLPLTPPNRRQRLEWCRARSTWMTEWHRVVFSDESRFCLSSDSRRVRVWRRRGERSNPAAIVERPTVRQRGIMVWGAIAYDSRSPLLRIQGTMTAQRYVDDVLRPVTLPYLQGVPNAIYQQDNARPHTARISQQALQDVQMLPWPPYSPDLSPIEHVWDIIGRRLHALPQPRSEDELWQMVEREWRAIPQDAIRTLIDSLPRRVAACIAVRGGPTCY